MHTGVYCLQELIEYITSTKGSYIFKSVGLFVCLVATVLTKLLKEF